jgi:hypothetical protein
MSAIHGRQKNARREAGRVRGKPSEKSLRNLRNSIVTKFGTTCDGRHRFDITARELRRIPRSYSTE